MFELLLVFLLAHFTADFLMQTDHLIQLKKSRLHKGLTHHVTCHLIVTSLFALLYAFIAEHTTAAFIADILIAAIVITMIHYFVDWIKEFLRKKYKQVAISASLYILDQILHIASIIVVLNMLGLISYTFNQFKVNLLDFLFGNIAFSDPGKLLMLLIILIIATQGVGYFLGTVLRDLSSNPSLEKGTYNITNEKTEIKTTFNEKGEKANEITTFKTEQFLKDSPQKIGRYIGMIERILIMIFIVQGTPHGLTFLIAVKSLTRFKQFENKRFAEYYLIGSLLSALIAVVLGYTVVRVI
jgi:hypothetical protein